MSNDNRGQVTREKQVTSNSQLETQASPNMLNSHTVSNTFSKNVSFFQWSEVAVLFSGIATALIERQELCCMRVRPTEREMCGSSLLSCTFCYFLGLVFWRLQKGSFFLLSSFLEEIVLIFGLRKVLRKPHIQLFLIN